MAAVVLAEDCWWREEQEVFLMLHSRRCVTVKKAIAEMGSSKAEAKSVRFRHTTCHRGSVRPSH